tara:strand:+ start:9862 stop:10638 length:777 start_codon:yes stop_codon:yes gene_type:complete
MSLGIIYNVWDGCELLEASIKSVRNVADKIVVCYQERSYYGNTISEYNINDVLHDLKNDNLIDELLLVNFQEIAATAFQAKQMEKIKYQLGLNKLESYGMDYFMVRAVDEFFIENELSDALNKTIANKYDRTFCQIQTYTSAILKDLENTDHVNSTLFYKLIRGMKIGESDKVPIYVDAVGKYGRSGNDYIFNRKELMMHHYRLLRLDLKRKAINSSISNKSFLLNQANNILDFQDKAQSCDNLFNIDIEKFVEKYCE